MMRLLAVALVLALGLPAAAPSAAQEAPLRDELIAGFLASYPDMQSLGQKHKDEAAATQPDPTDPFANTLRFMQNSSAREQFLDIARRHGFAGLEQWTSVASRVMRAYVAVTSAQEIAQMRGEIERARRQLAGDASLTAQQRAAAERQLDATQRMIDAFSSTPQDKAAVQPYLQQIAKVMPPR